LLSLSLYYANLTVVAFAVLTEHARALRSLKLHKSIIEASPDDSFPSFPSVMELHFREVTCDDECLSKVLQSFSALQNLTLAASFEQRCGFFKEIGTMVPQLRELSLAHNDYDVSDSVLWAIGAKCPLLRRLDVTGGFGITDAGVCGIAKTCKSLEEVVLNGCHSIADEALLGLAAQCPALRRIHLDHCTEVSTEAIDEVLRSYPSLMVWPVPC
jgi:hypothetical protein